MKYHPEYVDEAPDKDVQLYRSRLTGRLMLVGNPESAGIADKPKNGTSTGANRITVNTQTSVRSLKEAGGDTVVAQTSVRSPKEAGGDVVVAQTSVRSPKKAGGDLTTKEA